MGFKIEWASLIFGSKFTVFALFYFVFKGNFPSTIKPPSVTSLGGLYLEGLIQGGAYFRNFMVSLQGPVVRKLISANPGLNFNLGFFFFCSKRFPG